MSKEEINRKAETEPDGYTLLGSVLKLDVMACIDLAKKHIYLDTVSMLYLDEFQAMRMGEKPATYNQIRRKFRKALNTCVELGYCSKSFIGTTIYQSGDSFGGKKVLCYDFSQYLNVA